MMMTTEMRGRVNERRVARVIVVIVVVDDNVLHAVHVLFVDERTSDAARPDVSITRTSDRQSRRS